MHFFLSFNAQFTNICNNITNICKLSIVAQNFVQITMSKQFAFIIQPNLKLNYMQYISYQIFLSYQVDI